MLLHEYGEMGLSRADVFEWCQRRLGHSICRVYHDLCRKFREVILVVLQSEK
jgi:hypothetical protein